MAFKPIQKNNKAFKKAQMMKVVERFMLRGYTLVKVSSKGFIVKKGFEKDILCKQITALATTASNLSSSNQVFIKPLKNGDCLKKCEAPQETKASINS